jgi:hypothetical protein
VEVALFDLSRAIVTSDGNRDGAESFKSHVKRVCSTALAYRTPVETLLIALHKAIEDQTVRDPLTPAQRERLHVVIRSLISTYYAKEP